MSPNRCGPLAAWICAWRLGQVGADEVLDAVGGSSERHVTLGADGLLDMLATVRRTGEPVRAVFPVSGDLRGLPADSTTLSAALAVGEAVVSGGYCLTWEAAELPLSSRPTEVTWTLHAGSPAAPDSVGVADAQYELTEAIRDTASALAAADVGGGSRESLAALGALRRAGSEPNLPRGFPPRAVALVVQAERLAEVLHLASLDPVGGAVDRFGASARDSALRPLAVAVRRARTAGYNALSES